MTDALGGVVIDNHAHLDDKRFKKDIDEVVKRAKEKLDAVFLPASSFRSNRRVLQLHRAYPEFLYPMAGMDPMACLKKPEKIDDVEIWAKEEKDIIAIGEVGLEYYHAAEKKERQKINLRRFIALANEIHKPLVIHCREAWSDIFKELERVEVNVILHAFSGGLEEIKRAIDSSFYISLATNICYPENIRLIKHIPLDIMLLETDSPYLHPYRQGRNEPANVWESARKISEIKGIELKELNNIINKNTWKAFKVRGA